MVCPAVTRSSISRTRSFPVVPAPERGPRDSATQAPGSFRAAGAGRLGKGNFHRAWSPASLSADPSAPSSSGVPAALSRPQLPSSLRGAKPAGGGGLYRTRLPAKRLRLSLSRPPRAESSHLSGGGGWGTARPCSGSSCSFHHSEDARAGIAGSARRSAASYWPRRTLHTQQSAKEPESAALPCRSAPPSPLPGTNRFWPTRYRGRGSPRRCRRRAKAAPGRMLLPDSPYAERLQRARAGLCAAPASLRRVGARRRLSLRLLPFAAQLSSSARPVPAPLAESGSSRRRRGGWRCGARFTATPLWPPATRSSP